MTLLDYLTEIAGCEYLSDLHHVKIDEEEAEKILSLSKNCFPEKDYEDAVSYLLGKSIAKNRNVDELKKLIIQKLKGSK